MEVLNRRDSHQSHLKGLSVILPKGKVLNRMTFQGPASQPSETTQLTVCCDFFFFNPYLTVLHHHVATQSRNAINFESEQRP